MGRNQMLIQRKQLLENTQASYCHWDKLQNKLLIRHFLHGGNGRSKS